MEVVVNNVSVKQNQINLEDINYKLPKGKIVGIVGNNDFNKVAFLMLLAGKLKPNIGSIKYDQEYQDETNCFTDKTFIKIGYLEEEFTNSWDKKTVYEELSLVLEKFNYRLKEKEKRIDDVLKMVGLQDFKYREIKTMSLSEQKLFALATILIYNPKVLILNSPFQFLDQDQIKRIVNLFRLLKRRYNKTIVFTSSNVDLLHKISDDVIVMNEGKIDEINDKYTVFTNVKKLKKLGIDIPKVVLFSYLVLEKKKINIGYRDEINDLIKDIYRFV